MYDVSHRFYKIKDLFYAWKQGLSAKVFVMTGMKSVKEGKNTEDMFVACSLSVLSSLSECMAQ